MLTACCLAVLGACGARVLMARFTSLTDVPEAARRRLLHSRATHVIVHRDALRGSQVDIVERWLTARGATLVATFGNDRVFVVPR